MESYLCINTCKSKTNYCFLEGREYKVGVRYHGYMEVLHTNGMRCYLDIKLFSNNFIKYDSLLYDIDKLFNSIMDV